MKKTTKIIDGDKVSIIEDTNENFDDDLLPEYEIDNLKLIPNPYAEILRKQNKVTIQLDSDISEYFQNSRKLNNYLRKQIKLFKNTAKS